MNVEDADSDSESEDDACGGLQLPLSVQDTLQREHRKVEDALNQKIASLALENTNSQQAFDVYRERARLALKKTANELQSAEARATELAGLLQVRQTF